MRSGQLSALVATSSASPGGSPSSGRKPLPAAPCVDSALEPREQVEDAGIAEWHDLGQEQATPGMTAYAKLSCTAMAREVAATAREILGGNGILQDPAVMRHLCDLKAVYTYEGTYDINTLIAGREITGLSAFD